MASVPALQPRPALLLLLPFSSPLSLLAPRSGRDADSQAHRYQKNTGRRQCIFLLLLVIFGLVIALIFKPRRHAAPPPPPAPDLDPAPPAETQDPAASAAAGSETAVARARARMRAKATLEAGALPSRPLPSSPLEGVATRPVRLLRARRDVHAHALDGLGHT